MKAIFLYDKRDIIKQAIITALKKNQYMVVSVTLITKQKMRYLK